MIRASQLLILSCFFKDYEPGIEGLCERRVDSIEQSIDRDINMYFSYIVFLIVIDWLIVQCLMKHDIWGIVEDTCKIT